MKYFIAIFITLIITPSAYSQLGLSKRMAKEAKIIKELPLLVVMLDSENNNEFNENLKIAVNKSWTISPSVKFINESEWKTLTKDKKEKEKYAHLYYTNRMLQANAPNNSLLVGLLRKKVVTHFIFTPNTDVADLIFSLKNLQNDLNKGKRTKDMINEEIKNASMFLNDSLPSKTLLIEEEIASKNLKVKLDKLYKHDYEIVSKRTIDNAIISNDKNALYLRKIIIAQRPMTKTRKDNLTNTTTQTTRSFNLPSIHLYNASNNELLFGTSVNSEEITKEDIEMILKVKNAH